MTEYHVTPFISGNPRQTKRVTITKGKLHTRTGDLIVVELRGIHLTQRTPEGEKPAEGIMACGLLGEDDAGFYLYRDLTITKPRIRILDGDNVYLRVGERSKYNYRRYKLQL